MHRVRIGATLAALVLVSAGAIALASPGGERGEERDRWGKRARATLATAQGQTVGYVEFRQRGHLSQQRATVVRVEVWGLPAGFHGFHVHAVGSCVAPDFVSAGGHLNPGSATHPHHAGDLPSLLVNQEGTGRLVAETDRFTLEELRDADGSAVIVHANRDNYANIPTDRYEPDPDATTLATGDAGARLACGQVR
jgi:superoxide dismutase, Cu-Zn family